MGNRFGYSFPAMPDDQNENEDINRLWDELTDFRAGHSAAARDHLMEFLRARLKAKNVVWVGAVRTGEDKEDPLRGWRIGTVHYLHADALNEAAVAKMKKLWAKREADPVNLLSVRGAGEEFRAFTMRQAMPPEWFQAAYYETFYAGRAIFDALIALFPVNRDAESVFLIHADEQRGAFTDADIAFVSRALRGIKWFHRDLMLGQGLLVASAPLSPAERKVLKELLGDATEKEIAQRLDLAASTVHQYVTSVYRKYGVKGRAGLMSLWLNRAK